MDISPLSYITIGCVTGVFGIKGWVKVKSYTQPQENILKYPLWQLAGPSGRRVVEVAEYKVRPQGLVVSFKGIESRNDAELLRRSEVLIDKAELPGLPVGEYYWHQLIGLKVFLSFKPDVLLGAVSELMETGSNDVLIVVPCEGSIDSRDRLIPYIPEMYVKHIDLGLQCMYVDWDPDF
jgi:16S rRNA processing protein RimM